MIKPVYELIRSGKKAVIRGADISQGLTNLVMRVNRESIQIMIESLDKYYNGLVEKFSKAKNKSFLEVMEDQIKTINAICESDEVNTVNDLLVKINSLFSDNESGYDYIFSTIHKSKGTESEVVIIYQPELIGSKAKTEEEVKQEINLKWVAMSRSLNTLYMTVKQ
jgi:superfamily I DNA/RNA helicase